VVGPRRIVDGKDGGRASMGEQVLATRRSHRVVDLFSGAGGLSLGAARAGFVVCAAAELDGEAMGAHRLNFPRTAHLEVDVSGLTGQRLRSVPHLGDDDLAGIVGGPPCQGFSHIGRNDTCDPRNRLFVDFFRVVGEALPKFFLAENVPGIMRDGNALVLREAFSHVEGSYVLLPPMILSAHKYGAPTRRTRVFFYGYRPEEMRPLACDDFMPPRGVETIHVGEALKGLPVRINPNWQTEEQGWRVVHVCGDGYFAARLHGHIPPGVGSLKAIQRLGMESRASGCLGTVHSKDVARRYAKIESGARDPVSKSHRLDLNGFCPTLRAGTGRDRGRFQAVRPLHPTENRVVTPREAARLQGFPDWFQFSPTKWHSFRQIGSSVSPILAERIFSVIRGALENQVN